MRPRMPHVLTCRDVAEYATDYMDGALPLRTRLAVRLHLFVCRMCRAYLAQLRRTVSLLRGRGLAGPSPVIEGRIVQLAKQGQGSAP